MSRALNFLKRKHFENQLPKDIRRIIRGLKNEDICIDVGANVGIVSEIFLSKGAEVYAFEPHPDAFIKLLEVKRKYKKFTPLNESAGISEGKVKLYLHTSHHSDPLKFSTGSSLLNSKPNISEKFIVSDAIDFAKFLSRFPRIYILKMDIEGFEVELIPHLINLRSLNNVDHVFVETHEKKWPGLKDRTADMKQLVSASPYNNQIRWDWP
jgi:FkbM family methyltransferase